MASRSKHVKEPTLKDLDIINWQNFIVGTYTKDSTTLEEGQRKSLNRIEKLIPKIKKAYKVLVYSSGNSFIPIFLGSKYNCKITVLVENDQAMESIQNDVQQYEMEDYITVEKGNFEQTHYNYDHFDMIWSVNANADREKIGRLFREVRRIIVPQGRFLMLELTNNEEVENSYYTTDELEKLASRADLEKVYLKDFAKETNTHLSKLKEQFETDKKKLEKNIDGEVLSSSLGQLEKLQVQNHELGISWKFLQLQKLNA